MFVDQVELTPLKVWDWNKGFRLLHEPQRKALRYNLLPREEAKVTRFGIKFRELTYTCKVGVEEGWFEGNGIYGETKIVITYDPRNCSSIFLKYKNDLLQCLLTGRSIEFENLHFSEVEKIMEYRDSQIQEQEKLEKQYRAELHAYAEALNESAKESTKEATKDKSFYSRNQNKREVRSADSMVWGAMGAMSNVSLDPVYASNFQKSAEENIIKFPDNDEMIGANNSSTSEIQSLFSRKSQERRRGNNE